MEQIYREYRASDYSQCEQLVNQAWKFDKIFFPNALSDLAKQIYTKGSVLNSNYKRVIEEDGKVVGFIFGLNQYSTKPRKNILFGLRILWKLIFIKTAKSNKKSLISALETHEKNRSHLVSRDRSEIVLFVIDQNYRGQGIGTKLWNGFKNHCVESGVSSIIVESNKLGASGFYEKIGFKHLANFESPLHEFATKNGQACIYEYKIQ